MNKLIESTGENYSEQIGWEVFTDQNAKIANPFHGMETECDQRQTFKELFGFVVTIYLILGFHGVRKQTKLNKMSFHLHQPVKVIFKHISASLFSAQ